MKKRLLAGFLSICMIVCGAPAVLAASLPFRDVPSESWFYNGVSYVYEKGIMKGVAADLFEPDSKATRAMVVSILWRLDGSMKTVNEFFYQDEQENAWYLDAINWSSANGIMNGYSMETFGVDDPITREQLATVLYRYAGAVGCDVSAAADLSGYTDQSKISSYAVKAMSWANASGMIKGIDDKTLAPGQTATRAQIATIIERFEKIRKGASIRSGARSEAEILNAVKKYAELEMKKDPSIACEYADAYIYAQNYKAAIVFMFVHSSEYEDDGGAIEAIWVSKDNGATRSIDYIQDYWPAMFDVTLGVLNENDTNQSGHAVDAKEALRLAEKCSKTLSEDGIIRVNPEDIWIYDQNENAFIIYVGVRDGYYGNDWYDAVWVNRDTADVMYISKMERTDIGPGLFDVDTGKLLK